MPLHHLLTTVSTRKQRRQKGQDGEIVLLNHEQTAICSCERAVTLLLALLLGGLCVHGEELDVWLTTFFDCLSTPSGTGVLDVSFTESAAYSQKETLLSAIRLLASSLL